MPSLRTLVRFETMIWTWKVWSSDIFWLRLEGKRFEKYLAILLVVIKKKRLRAIFLPRVYNSNYYFRPQLQLFCNYKTNATRFSSWQLRQLFITSVAKQYLAIICTRKHPLVFVPVMISSANLCCEVFWKSFLRQISLSYLLSLVFCFIKSHFCPRTVFLLWSFVFTCTLIYA